MPIPAAPSNLVAVPITASKIVLTWVDNSADELNFELQRSPNGTSGWTLINSPAANATTYTDSGLAQNTQFWYRIRASNASGVSVYSNIANALTLIVSRVPFAPRIYLHTPAVVLAAQVNWFPASYPLDLFDIGTITAGTVAAVKAGMTVLLGSAPGLDDYGRQRVRLDGSGVRIFVGRSSYGKNDGELMLSIGAYVTVLYDRRIWAKMPYIAPDGTIYKDSDLVVGTNTTTPPPVANTGPGFAGTIAAGVISVLFNGQSSFATADGATITDYLWDIEDGTLVSGALTDDNITVTFPAGFRYVSLTVTDSNGKTHTAYCPVYARDPAADTSFEAFQIESHRITAAGQSLSVRILADMPRITYPDGTLAMLWDFEPTGTADRNHMLIIGWLDTENANINAGRTGLLRDTTLTILDAAGKMDSLPGLPQSLAADSTRDTGLISAITWSYMTLPNLDKYLHYLLHWHSTLLELTDFVWSGTGNSYDFILLTSDGDSLWNQVNRRARAFLPDFVLTCDRAGRVAIVPDPRLRDVADRTAVVQSAITEDEWSDIRFGYQRAPRTHWLRSSAILEGTTEPIGTVFSIAPGDTPGQGLGEMTQGEQLAVSQTVLNAATGHRYARANAPTGPLTITLIQDDGWANAAVPWREIEPAWMEWVTLTMSAATAAQRGLAFTAARGLPTAINIRYNHTRSGLLRTVELTWEQEISGPPGKTVLKPIVPAVGANPSVPPTAPPDFGLIGGQELVAGIGEFELYRTADFQTASGSGGPTYTAHNLTTSDEIYSWVVDPFSPGYAPGATSGAINGWVATPLKIYRVTDIFGTVGCTAVHTFATAASGASHWRTIQASFGAYFAAGVNPWLLCISYYGSTAGHTGTWAMRSLDGGVTWSAEVQISAYYDTGLTTRQPIGVYTSPKTPGLAYTAAHVAQSANPDEPLPMWATWDDGGSLTLLGLGVSASYEVNVTETGAVPGTTEDGGFVILAPPANTKRMIVGGTWEATRTRTGGLGTVSTSLDIYNATATSRTDDLAFTTPAYNTTNNGTFTIEWSFGAFATQDWPVNSDSIVTSPPGSPAGARLRTYTNCNGTAGQTVTGNVTITLTVTEIELDDSTIYVPAASDSDPALADGHVSTDWGAAWGGMNQIGMIAPGHAQAGDIHLPWEGNPSEALALYGHMNRSGNRQFRLKSADGTTISDISPSDGTRSYGVGHYGFAIRAHDNNRQYLLLSGTGNDTTALAANDYQAVYKSSNYGDSWTNIVAPVNSTVPYSAAFGGDSEQIIFLFGPAAYFGYSSNMGAAIDSRAGNLAALSASKIVGIAGGPTP